MPPLPPQPLDSSQATEDAAERTARLGRIAAENSKKRKLQNRGLAIAFGGGAKKASGIALRGGAVAFGADSDDEDGKGGSSGPGAGGSRGAGTTAELTSARKEEIVRTAEWLAKNPGNEATILAKSKGNPKFSFLFEGDSTPEGG